MPESLNAERECLSLKTGRRASGDSAKEHTAIVIAGIAVIMVGAIAFSGGSTSKTVAKPVLPAGLAVIDPNQARIAEYASVWMSRHGSCG